MSCVATKVCLSRQNVYCDRRVFVATKTILVAALANDSLGAERSDSKLAALWSLLPSSPVEPLSREPKEWMCIINT